MENNKILVMGKFTIERHHWKSIKEILKLGKDDKVVFKLVNKPENHVLTKEEVAEYALVITTQTNAVVLRNVKKVLGDIPLVKPYKNKNKELTHFMVVNEVIVEYKYELFEINKHVPKKGPNAKNNKPAPKKVAPKKENNLDEMLKVLDENPAQEKPKKRRRY